MSEGALTFPMEGTWHEAGSAALVTDRDAPTDRLWGGERASGVLVGDAERERMFEQCISEIEGYRHLERNWDTYGGVGASEQAIRFSRNVMRSLQTRPEILSPHVCPISTGVYLEWRSGDRLLYFEVDEDSLLFVMREGNRDLEEGEDPDFRVGQAVELVERFHRVDSASAEGITQRSA